MHHPLFFLLLLLGLASSFNEGLTGAEKDGGRKLAGENPITAKASLIRYWKNQVSNNLPTPWFFLNKASPLNAIQLATFSKILAEPHNSLSTRFPSFCSKANLLRFPDLFPSLENHGQDITTKTSPTTAPTAPEEWIAPRIIPTTSFLSTASAATAADPLAMTKGSPVKQ